MVLTCLKCPWIQCFQGIIRFWLDFQAQKRLIDDGLLESLDIVMLVDELMCHYDIEISVEDLIPENFNSAEAIYALVQRLKDEE